VKQHLKRSVTFWSGMVVVIFLCWAWADSMFYGSTLRWNCFMAENENGGIQVNSAYSFSGFSAGRSAALALPKNSYSPVVAAPLILRGKSEPGPEYHPSSTYRGSLEMMMARRKPEAWLVFIPHWLLLLAVALPWSILLFWRARWRKQAVLLA